MTSQKFGRSYRVVIDPKDGGDPIIIAMPITVQFWVKRNTMSSLNYMSLDIYNLSPNLRDRIFQDRYVVRDRTVTLEGGYDSLSLMFKGIIFEANSARDGTNIITRIEARDGNFDVSSTKTFQTIERGKSVKDVLEFLTGQFPTLERGAIGSYDDTLNRPVVLNGNTYDLLKKYSAGDVHVDNNKVFILKKNEVIEGEIPVINIDTGILETPRRDDGFLNVTTLFEPRVTIDQIIDLQSAIMPIYNGQYKVLGVMHQGIISEAVGGACRSTFDLWTGNTVFEIVGQNG